MHKIRSHRQYSQECWLFHFPPASQCRTCAAPRNCRSHGLQYGGRSLQLRRERDRRRHRSELRNRRHPRRPVSLRAKIFKAEIRKIPSTVSACNLRKRHAHAVRGQGVFDSREPLHERISARSMATLISQHRTGPPYKLIGKTSRQGSLEAGPEVPETRGCAIRVGPRIRILLKTDPECHVLQCSRIAVNYMASLATVRGGGRLSCYPYEVVVRIGPLRVSQIPPGCGGKHSLAGCWHPVGPPIRSSMARLAGRIRSAPVPVPSVVGWIRRTALVVSTQHIVG